jgi:hypothetical protein
MDNKSEDIDDHDKDKKIIRKDTGSRSIIGAQSIGTNVTKSVNKLNSMKFVKILNSASFYWSKKLCLNDNIKN